MINRTVMAVLGERERKILIFSSGSGYGLQIINRSPIPIRMRTILDAIAEHFNLDLATITVDEFSECANNITTVELIASRLNDHGEVAIVDEGSPFERPSYEYAFPSSGRQRSAFIQMLAEYLEFIKKIDTLGFSRHFDETSLAKKKRERVTLNSTEKHFTREGDENGTNRIY